MGICIQLLISKSVTEEEWEKVYEESLKLVEAFPLAERNYIKYKDEKVICMIPTKERDLSEDFGGKKKIGWCASSDYETLYRAEDYYFLKNLVEKNNVEEDAGDAMLGILAAYTSFDWDDPRSNQVYELWGNKTQGEPYHMYLLAIACMVQERLGNKAFIYGNITQDQCEKAVEMANENLSTPICVPVNCDMERLFQRVKELPIEERDKMVFFLRIYLGAKDKDFGKFIRLHFSEKVIIEYWKEYFGENPTKDILFYGGVEKFLSMGFDFETLSSIVEVPKEELEKMHYEDIPQIIARDMKQEENLQEKIEQNIEQYDISSSGDLIYYETGDSVEPGLQKALGESYRFYNNTTQESRYKLLMKESAFERCKYLIEKNRYIMIRDTDWQHIFQEIENNPESFERYYPMVRIDTSLYQCNQMVVAFALNDELYLYSRELSKSLSE